MTTDHHPRPTASLNADRYAQALTELNAIASADDDAYAIIRDLLIDSDTHTISSLRFEFPDERHAMIDRCVELIRLLDDCPLRDAISMLRLDYSLCPLHAIDYAICFDDDNPECAALRACFNSHDT
jgi:hypothetical protein